MKFRFWFWRKLGRIARHVYHYCDDRALAVLETDMARLGARITAKAPEFLQTWLTGMMQYVAEKVYKDTEERKTRGY